MEQWIYITLMGAAAGFIASNLMKGRGMGLLMNIIVGIVGAVIGGWIFSALKISAGGGILGSLITAVVGAMALLWIVGMVKKR